MGPYRHGTPFAPGPERVWLIRMKKVLVAIVGGLAVMVCTASAGATPDIHIGRPFSYWGREHGTHIRTCALGVRLYGHLHTRSFFYNFHWAFSGRHIP